MEDGAQVSGQDVVNLVTTGRLAEHNRQCPSVTEAVGVHGDLAQEGVGTGATLPERLRSVDRIRGGPAPREEKIAKRMHKNKFLLTLSW